MNLPQFISTQAILKPKHGDTSVEFDPKAWTGPSSLRGMLPDPQKVKGAVAEFKRLGFGVSFVGKFSLSIEALQGLYEEHFGVSISLEDQDSESGAVRAAVVIKNQQGKRLDVIPVTENEILKDAVSELLIPADYVLQSSGEKPPEKISDSHLYPDEIRSHLVPPKLLPTKQLPNRESDEIKRIDGSGVKINILDSGCNINHPYLNYLKISSRIEVSTPDTITSFLDDIKKAHKKYEEIGKIHSDLVSFKRNNITDSKFDFTPLRNFVTKYKSELSLKEDEVSSLEKLIKEYPYKLIIHFNLLGKIANLKKPYSYAEIISKALNKLKDENDYNGHGTMMVASALSVASRASINAWKGSLPKGEGQKNPQKLWEYETLFLYQAFEEITDRETKKESQIISNSYGEFIGNTNNNEDYKAQVDRWKELVAEGVKKGFSVLFAAGNSHYKGEEKDLRRSAQAATGSAGAIIVGGAYYDGEKNLKATEAAQGYPITESQSVPDVCGLVGPLQNNKTSPYVYLPSMVHLNGDGDWHIAGGGTSSATAQVAGVCACILQAWPNASPSDIKFIITETATVVKDGETFQGVKAENLEGLRLVNVRNAITSARESGSQSPLGNWPQGSEPNAS